MQHQHSDEFINAAPAPAAANAEITHATPSSIHNNNIVDDGDEGEIDLEASLQRIGALSESLSAIVSTRKRPAENHHRHSNSRSAKSEKRDSLTTSIASSEGPASSFVVGIDDLVHNLEDLEFVDNAAAANDMSLSRMSLGGDSLTSWNDSTASRLSSGLWSLQDVEPWTCSTCTFDNEPVFLACEMCGQTRPARKSMRETSSSNELLEGSARLLHLEADNVRVLQEQRLSELQQFKTELKPAAAIESATTTQRRRSPLPPLSSSVPMSKRRSVSPKRPRRATTRRNRSSNNMSPRKTVSTTTTTRSKSPPRVSLSSLSGHSSTRSSGCQSRDSSIRDLLLSDLPSLQKPRRSTGGVDPHDSAATATTFDMSSSNYDFSTSSFDYVPPPPPPERLSYPAGIQEEDEAASSGGSRPNSTHVRRYIDV